MIHSYQKKKYRVFPNTRSPKELKSFIDRYVIGRIGQDEAKNKLSVAVQNHYKRLSASLAAEKSNILLGKTGTVKTLLGRSLSRFLNVPFPIVDATTN